MKDLWLRGGTSGVVYQPDALDNYAQSVETDTVLHYISKAYAPIDWGAEVIFRRLYITVQYDSEIELEVALYVDGKKIDDSITILRRALGSERHTWTIPLTVNTGDGFTTALRGSSVQVEVKATAPIGRWYLLPPIVEWAPALSRRHPKE